MASPLTCDHCEEFLRGYLLSAPGAVEAAAVAEHLHTCARCQASLAAYEAVVERLAHAVPSHEPPAELQQRLMAAVTDTPPAAGPAPAPSQPHGWTAWWPRWAFIWHRLRVTAALSLVVTWALTSVLTRSPAVEHLTDAAVSAHRRSLTAHHLTDVASADPRSVAAWFQGQLPFVPLVRDLRAQGFTLAGGRLDYLYKGPVAALVYRHGDHLINVFVWPASRREHFPVQMLWDEGFHIMFWTRSGTHYCAISDLGQRDFVAFVHSYVSPSLHGAHRPGSPPYPG
jgi:anti-sigma factor RsiW